MACSIPPTYTSTGIHLFTFSALKGACLLWASRYRRKYQEESKKVSRVSTSLVAGLLQVGHVVLTKEGMWESGYIFYSVSLWSSNSGSSTRSWETCWPQESQLTTGIGTPQYLWRPTSQFLRRYSVDGEPLFSASSFSPICFLPSSSVYPLNSWELTRRPSSS